MTTSDTDTRIEMIRVADCHPHPDNPRLFQRQEVIDAIAASLAEDGFKQQHAIHVRPYGDGYQIIAGHHRIEAAVAAGLAEIPAWVEVMDDDEALWRLGLDNRQSGMEPLEWGKWLNTLPKSAGGRGKTGGRIEQADAIGRHKSEVSRFASAWTVAESVGHDQQFENLPDYRTLATIATTHRDHWPALVDAAKSKTRDDIARLVKQIKSLEIEDRWAAWLPPAAVVERMIAGEGMSPATVAKLQRVADAAVADVEAKVGHQSAAALVEWLVEAAPDSWSDRAIDAKQREIVNAAHEADDAIQWHHGRWQDHIDELDDGSVALLLTDPPYGMDYQSNRRKERHAKIANDTVDGVAQDVAACFAAMYEKMQDDSFALVFCKFPLDPFEDALVNAGFAIRRDRKPLVWAKHNHGSGDLDGFAPQYEPVVVAMKGDPKLLKRISELLPFGRPDTDRHPTEKPIDLLRHLISATTAQGEIVADPYGGVASTAVAAKLMKRGAWSCEISQDYFNAGRRRIDGCQ